MPQQRILLLSAYDAASHRYWHQQLINGLPAHDWQLLSLKDRHFAWRMGGNALSFKHHHHLQLSQSYDRLIATSMTDLCRLRGLYPHLSQIPNHLYFHENQFSYPPNNQQQGLLEVQLSSLFSALVADQLVFNSAYNRDSFLQGVTDFTNKMPDGLPPQLAKQLAAKSMLLPVPIKDDCQHQPTAASNTLQVVWNHRWEHDKGPETLLEVLRLSQAHNIRFHILGQQFRNCPKAMHTIQAEHAHQCLNLGYLPSRTDYLNVLQQADVVLSTARHDFQGIAMLEGVACGCVPIAPQRLVYPELYPAANLYPSTPDDPQQEARAIMALLQRQLPKPSIQHHWQQLKPAYQNWLEPAC